MEIDDKSSGLRVASFSCYLDTAKESLVHRVSAQDSNMSIKFSNTKESNPQESSLRVDSFETSSSSSLPIKDPTSAFSFSHHVTPKDSEIGVFGADRYFNMKLEYQTPSKKIQIPTNLGPTTPSLCSESTSAWNSQTTLLPDLRQHNSQMKQKKAMATRLFMGFGCRGPCFDKKSVNINAQRAFYGPPPPPPEAAGAAAKKQLILEESRRSIEVFGSQKKRASKGDVATNMERKLSMLTWDAIPKGRGVNLPTSTVCDDEVAASDASSDLFEIENISGSIFPLLESEAAAAAGDDVSTCMSPTSLYAPSEASIQWSVVTASVADYSALSEFNDDSVSVAAAGKKMVAEQRGSKMRTTKQTRPAAGFLGCKNDKAVDVAQNIVCVKTNKD